jgi:hypothetical protein
MKHKSLGDDMEPATEEETEQLAEQFLDEWELHAFLINDEKLREKDET